MVLRYPFLAIVLVAVANARPGLIDVDDDTIKSLTRNLQTVIDGAAKVGNLFSDIRSKRPLQSVAVTGELLCDGDPVGDVKLKLYDHDTFTANDLMAVNRTADDGYFYLEGSEREFTRITPKLDIFHTCGKVEDCLRKLTIYIPKSYVNRGDSRNQVFDIGAVELSGRFSGQSDECFE